MIATDRRTIVVAVLGATALLTWGGIRASELFAFDVSSLSAEALAALVAAAVLAWVVVARPAFGLGLLVALVWLDLSEVLVRNHDIPSILQILAAPLALAAWIGARGRVERHPLTRPLTLALLLWLLLVMASTTWAADPSVADERLAETAKAFAIYALAASLAVTRARVFLAAWTMVGSATLLAALGVYQAVTGSYDVDFGGLARVKDAQIWGDVFQGRIAGPLGDPNYFAQILLVVVPVALLLAHRAGSSRARWAGFGAAGLLAAAVALSYSRGGAMTLVIVVALSLVAMRIGATRLAALGLVALLAFAAVLPSDLGRRLGTITEILPGVEGHETLDPDSSFEKRKLVTTVAWLQFLERPILGVGAGNYTTHFDRIAAEVGSATREYGETSVRQYPHSLYLEVAAETGLVGLVVFGAAVVVSIHALLRARGRFQRAGDPAAADLSTAFAIAIAGYLISSLFLHGDFQRYLWLLFAFAAALEALAPERA